ISSRSPRRATWAAPRVGFGSHSRRLVDRSAAWRTSWVSASSIAPREGCICSYLAENFFGARAKSLPISTTQPRRYGRLGLRQTASLGNPGFNSQEPMETLSYATYDPRAISFESGGYSDARSAPLNSNAATTQAFTPGTSVRFAARSILGAERPALVH